MTYAEILTRLQAMTIAELEQTATVYDGPIDEYFPITDILSAGIGNDVFDEGQFYFRF